MSPRNRVKNGYAVIAAVPAAYANSGRYISKYIIRCSAVWGGADFLRRSEPVSGPVNLLSFEIGIYNNGL
jgi:hypothetical protein